MDDGVGAVVRPREQAVSDLLRGVFQGGQLAVAALLFASCSPSQSDGGVERPGPAEGDSADVGPPVELATLRERSRPGPSSDGLPSFHEIVALRDRPDPAAVPTLEGILVDHSASSRIHRYAATQALYAIGTDAALRVLDRHTSQPGFNGRLAFDYAFHWNMEPASRDGYLDRCVLRSTGEAPALSLRFVGASETPQRLTFEVTVRNDSDQPMEVLDPAARGGELLVFRGAGGRVARTARGGTCEHMGAGIARLDRGESSIVPIVVELISPKELPGEAGVGPAGATVAARSSGYTYSLDQPGGYDVIARWTSARGRSVSAPVRVVVPPLR